MCGSKMRNCRDLKDVVHEDDINAAELCVEIGLRVAELGC